VGEGTFSHVFRAVDRHKNEKAVKIPRKFTTLKNERFEFVPTQVFIKRQSRFTPQEASPVHLLRIQVARTRQVLDQGLVRIEDYSFDGENSHCRMPFLVGRTFRDYMRSGPVPIAVLRNLALTLSRLNHLDNYNYHGDVKPENMIVTNSGVILVDCGYFGNVHVGERTDETQKTLIVTTPRYYPRLLPDDLLALGLIIWEAAMRNPLIEGVAYSGDYESAHISDRLMDIVLEEEALGNFNFTPVLGAEKPASVREGLPANVENLLLRAVRLKFNKQNQLDIDEGFESFEDLADELKKLTQSGIHYL
jgi:serine/threonine protein kinase